MTSAQQRAELQRRIWQIANDVRGAVDGWDFKQYVLGTLFYRFISENFIDYITGGDASVNYAAMADDDKNIAAAKDDAIKTKGYFIYPSQLFVNVVATANTNESLNTDLANIFKAIEASASGYPSEQDIKGLFADFDTTSNRLGNTVKDKNARLAAVLKGVAELDFGDFDASHIDLFGDAYEFLISNYAANAGKSGGEFFTPQHVSKLIAQLAANDYNLSVSSYVEAKDTLLRNLYEKTASFLGYPKWSELLPDDKQLYYSRIINFTSHSTLSNEAVAQPTPAERRYIATSLKREFASENGTELNAVLPKMSPLNPQYLTKKQSVFQKMVAFVEKFKGVGGQV